MHILKTLFILNICVCLWESEDSVPGSELRLSAGGVLPAEPPKAWFSNEIVKTFQSSV